MTGVMREALGQVLGFIWVVLGFWFVIMALMVHAHIRTGGPGNPKGYEYPLFKRLKEINDGKRLGNEESERSSDR